MAGVPCIRGTQIPVSAIIGRIAEGMTTAEIIAEYPQIDTDDIAAAVTFTAMAVDVRELSLVDPVTSSYAGSRYRPARRAWFGHRRGKKVEGLAAELVAAPDDVASELGIASGSWVIRRRSIAVDDDGPVQLSTSWYDGELAERTPRLLNPAHLRNGAIPHIERATSRRAATSHESIAVRLATAEERRLLDLAGSRPPVVVVHDIVADTEGTPIELTEVVVSLARWVGAGNDAAVADPVARVNGTPGPAAGTLDGSADRGLEDKPSGQVPLAGAADPALLQQGGAEDAVQLPTGQSSGSRQSWFDQYGPLLFVAILALIFVFAVAVLLLAPWM